MYALEFQADVIGDKIQIPTHLLNRLPKNGHVKTVLIFSEESDTSSTLDLKSEILKIGKQCSSLPLLDNRTADEILGYEDDGLLT